MIQPSPYSILDAARTITDRLPQLHSEELPTAVDAATATEVPSWRSRGIPREHALHGIMPRVGGFPPALARYFIASYSGPGDVVLDPFCGKGTTLFEASAMQRRGVGGDVAPDAVIATRAKCTPITICAAANYIEGLRAPRQSSVPDIPRDVRLFYHRQTLAQLLAIREQLLADMESVHLRRVATFTCGVLLGLLHGHSQLSLSLPCNQCFAMSPPYVRRYVAEHKLVRPVRDVKSCLLNRVLQMLPRPRRMLPVRVFEASAEECLRYAGRNAVSLVLTSPPYLSKQTYTKDAWLRLWFLGRDRKEVYAKAFETGSIRLFVERMTAMLNAIAKTLVPGGRIVLVNGRAKADFGPRTEVVRIADLCGYAASMVSDLEPEYVIRDERIMKRGSYFAVYAGRTNGNGGSVQPRRGDEDILVLRKRA